MSDKINIQDIMNMERYDLLEQKLYETILNDKENCAKLEQALYDRAKAFKIVGAVKENFAKYKKDFEFKEQLASTIDFGNKAPIRQMSAPGYYKDSNNAIRKIDRNILVTSTLLQTVGIFKNIETR